jgi:hypothetical protein
MRSKSIFMKQTKLRQRRAFTLVEFIVVVCCTLILVFGATMLMPRQNRFYSYRIRCVNNLKQIGMAYVIWPDNPSGTFPAEASQSDGGLYESLTNANQGTNCWKIFNVMSNELGMSPKVLICPSDVRTVSSSGITFKPVFLNANTNLSYFAGIGANFTYPNSILGGDRNIGPGLVSSNDFGYSPMNGMGNDVTLSTNPAISPICWSLKMHSEGRKNGAGNVLLGDGSVRQVTSLRLRTECQAFAGAPFVKGPTTNAPTSSTFRLLFP